MLLLAIGFFVGTFFGIFVMGLLQISRESDKPYKGRD